MYTGPNDILCDILCLIKKAFWYLFSCLIYPFLREACQYSVYNISIYISSYSCHSPSTYPKMPHPRSARSDVSDGEMEGIAEAELVRLQRQFRIMENDRAAYTEESQNMIRKQK